MRVVGISVRICLELSKLKLCICALWCHSCQVMTDVVFLCIDTDIILIGDTIQANFCLVLAQIKECQVRDWIVGK